MCHRQTHESIKQGRSKTRQRYSFLCENLLVLKCSHLNQNCSKNKGSPPEAMLRVHGPCSLPRTAIPNVCSATINISRLIFGLQINTNEQILFVKQKIIPNRFLETQINRTYYEQQMQRSLMIKLKGTEHLANTRLHTVYFLPTVSLRSYQHSLPLQMRTIVTQ